MGERVNKIISAVRSLFAPHCHERIFAVGGCVRDHLRGRGALDIDLAAALSDAELVEHGFYPVVAVSATPVWFMSHPRLGKIEITQLPDVSALSADLERRDFTINAMAMTMAGELLDPLGGQADLHAGCLRVCSTSSFAADPLRLFRAFRFVAAGWQMSGATEALISSKNWQEELRNLPVERFSGEMLKALAQPEPERFFALMLRFNCGVAQLPELFRMPEIPAGPLVYHPEGDLYRHATEVLQRVALQSAEPLARFCAFFHDVGKLATDPARYPKHHGHDQAGVPLAEALCERLRLPVAYRRALAGVSRYHGTANLWHELRAATKLKMAEQAVKAGIVQILPLVSAADKAGNSRIAEWDEVVAIAGMTCRELGIEVEKLEQIRPAKRAELILQKRVELLCARGQN
jgi:tRNA nucleotidyltransferase (CCA-adding enzyme)